MNRQSFISICATFGDIATTEVLAQAQMSRCDIDAQSKRGWPDCSRHHPQPARLLSNAVEGI